jgi:hypothetical protein
MSTRRRTGTYGKQRAKGSNGRPVCLWCDRDIVDPKRSTFCRKACAEEFYLRSRPHYARQKVFERDKGVCHGCGRNVFEGTGRTPRARGTGDLWQAHHATAVIEGGGECGLDGYETQCTACHKIETAALAVRMADKRKQQRQQPNAQKGFWEVYG